MATGYGAGAGADMLQEILRRQATDAYQQGQLKLEQQRVALEQQRNQQAAEYQRAYLQSMDAERQAREQEIADKRGLVAGSQFQPGDVIDPTNPAVKVLNASVYAGALSPDKTLSSTNLSGPAGGPMQQTANPGQATGMLRFAGLPQQIQQQKENAQLDALAAASGNPNAATALRVIRALPENERGPATARLVNETLLPQKPQTENVYQTGPDGKIQLVGTVPTGSHIANAPNAPQDHYSIQQVTGPDGKPQFVRVNTQTGAVQPVDLGTGVTAGKPNATLGNRLASAEAATQTGQDIIAALHDPKVASTIGPAMGRVSSLADWLGNPPEEYADLMGNIHSYALSQLGIHGMRSSQAAEQIRKDLSGVHTPQALEGYIRGLGKFSEHLLNNSKGGGAGTVKMRAPNGQISDVPSDQVEHYKTLGATVVSGG